MTSSQKYAENFLISASGAKMAESKHLDGDAGQKLCNQEREAGFKEARKFNCEETESDLMTTNGFNPEDLFLFSNASDTSAQL